MGELDGVGAGPDGMGKCCPVDVGWVFIIQLILSHMLVPHRADGCWCDWEGPQICGGSLIPFKITLSLYFTSHFVSVKILERLQAWGHVLDVCPSSTLNPHKKHTFMLLYL